MTASDRLSRGGTRARGASSLSPQGPAPGWRPGGGGSSLQSEGADTDPRTSTPSPAAPNRAAASARPGHASCSRGRCHPLVLSLSPRPPPSQPPLPRRCSSCSGLLPPPLPRPLCPTSQPIRACRCGLLAQSLQCSRPPHCPASEGAHALANHYARLSHQLSRLDHGVTDMAPVNWQLQSAAIPELERESGARRTVT